MAKRSVPDRLHDQISFYLFIGSHDMKYSMLSIFLYFTSVFLKGEGHSRNGVYFEIANTKVTLS